MLVRRKFGFEVNFHGGVKRRGKAMRVVLPAAFILMASTVSAFAGIAPVPEIDALSGLAAMGLVGSVATLLWERRRRKK